MSLGIDTTISPGKVSMQQWTMLFETNSNTQSAVLSEAIRSLRYQQKNGQTIFLKKDGENIAQNDTIIDINGDVFTVTSISDSTINLSEKLFSLKTA